jgi:hypothetical protein
MPPKKNGIVVSHQQQHNNGVLKAEKNDKQNKSNNNNNNNNNNHDDEKSNNFKENKNRLIIDKNNDNIEGDAILERYNEPVPSTTTGSGYSLTRNQNEKKRNKNYHFNQNNLDLKNSKNAKNAKNAKNSKNQNEEKSTNFETTFFEQNSVQIKTNRQKRLEPSKTNDVVKKSGSNHANEDILEFVQLGEGVLVNSVSDQSVEKVIKIDKKSEKGEKKTNKKFDKNEIDHIDQIDQIDQIETNGDNISQIPSNQSIMTNSSIPLDSDVAIMLDNPTFDFNYDDDDDDDDDDDNNKDIFDNKNPLQKTQQNMLEMLEMLENKHSPKNKNKNELLHSTFSQDSTPIIIHSQNDLTGTKRTFTQMDQINLDSLNPNLNSTGPKVRSILRKSRPIAATELSSQNNTNNLSLSPHDIGINGDFF